MKRVFLVVIAVVALGMYTASAQVIVGGGIGIDLNGGKVKAGSTEFDMPKTFTFQFTPKVGYYVTESVAIGVEFGFLTRKETTPKELLGGNDDRVVSLTGWSAGVFGRYGLVGIDNLLLSLEAGIGFGGVSSKSKQGSIENENDPISLFNIGVVPVLNYRLSDMLSVEVSSDFLRLGYLSMTEKDKDNSDNKATEYDFGFGLNTSPLNIFGIVPIRVGLLFKF